MHLTEVAPVTQIRPLRPVAAAVQTSSAVKTAELQTQFVDRGCSCWADRLAEAMLMLIDAPFVMRVWTELTGILGHFHMLRCGG